MQKEITITVKPDDEKNQGLLKSLINTQLKNLGIRSKNIHPMFIKKSIDARRGQLKIHLRYKIYIDEEPPAAESLLPKWKNVSNGKSPSVLIVGAGPAGLFGALKLLEHGIKPIIIERGKETLQRKQDIAKISTKNLVNEDSNYCFGEGGAGTFSDGKLYTRSNKRGNIDYILKIFAHFGADEKILTDAHPHIGTDRLPKVINSMRNKILELGGEIHFDTKVTEFLMDSGLQKNDCLSDEKSDVFDGKRKIKTMQAKGVKTVNVINGEEKIFTGDAILLATGHSANDIYALIAKNAPDALEAKTFAAGVRVEHPRELIDAIQYHGKKSENLGAAEYRVTAQIDGRGVYSFCMCPGGFVVPSSSGPNEIVVNGMSAAARNSKWSNAAIVVEIRPEDIPENFISQAKDLGCPQLAGLLFRTYIENQAYMNGKGQSAPAQLLKDFIAGKKSDENSLPKTSYTPGIVSSDLNKWLPKIICERLKKGFVEINKNMKGFISDSAVMIAPETRTSTPVRILRDKDSFECTEIKNLFPAGEGSGYSGGIVSSAMDGENACEKIAGILKP